MVSDANRPGPSSFPSSTQLAPRPSPVANRKWLPALSILATLAVSCLIGVRSWKIGIPDEWQWEFYEQPASWVMALPALVLAAAMAAVVAFARRTGLTNRRREAAALGATLLLALGIILTLGDAGPAGSLETLPRTASPWISGYYAEAVGIEDMGAYLRAYPERISGLKVNVAYGHLSDHPAGPVVFHWLVNRLMEGWPALADVLVPDEVWEARIPVPGAGAPLTAPQLAMSIMQKPTTRGEFAGIWASALLYRLAFWLTLVPVYFIGRRLGSPEVGLLAAALTAFVPSLHLFGPYPDQVFPLILAGAFYAWLRALDGPSAGWSAVSAALIVLGLLWTLAFLAGVVLLAATALLHTPPRTAREAGSAREAGTEPQPVAAKPASGDVRCRLSCVPGLSWLFGRCRSLAGVVSAWAVAFLAASLLPAAFFGYDTFDVWRICFVQHASFATHFPRSYLAWTLFNPVEFAVFAGMMVSLPMVFSAAEDARRWWRERRSAALPALPWALLAVLAALDLSGKNLGEVGRLWMFLTPFAAVAAARWLARVDNGGAWSGTALLAAATQLAAFRLNLNVLA